MFTGIIETLGVVEEASAQPGGAVTLCICSPISSGLVVGQSVAHNGVCLTVTRADDARHWAIAVGETLAKSTLRLLLPGHRLNLERAMPAYGRFDGHIMQGHVDQVGHCVCIHEQADGRRIDFSYDAALGNITVEKGSIAVDGVSLTCFHSGAGVFSVALIPHTWENTALHALRPGAPVNLEFDIVGKYIQRLSAQRV